MIDIRSIVLVGSLVLIIVYCSTVVAVPNFLMFPGDRHIEDDSQVDLVDIPQNDLIVVPIRYVRNMIDQLKMCQDECQLNTNMEKRNSELINNLLSLPKSLKKAGK
ncbi:Uncharacterised protein g4655 [Pycnogonum litorale]